MTNKHITVIDIRSVLNASELSLRRNLVLWAGAGWIERAKWHDVYTRPPKGLQCLGESWQYRVELPRRSALLYEIRGQPADEQDGPRHARDGRAPHCHPVSPPPTPR